jgi:multidrug resistance efflux pump
VQSTVEQLKASSSRTTTAVAKLGDRVSALEAPVKKAMQARDQRRLMWRRMTVYAATVGTVIAFLWGQVARPVWDAVAPAFVQRWIQK